MDTYRVADGDAQVSVRLSVKYVMKSFFLLFAILLSANLSAQVATGGDYFGALSFVRKQMAIQKVTNFEKQLEKRIAQCSGRGTKVNSRSLVNLYIDLSIYRDLNSRADKCDSANAYLQCLNSEEIAKNSQKLKNDNDAALYLTFKHKIEKEKAQEVLNFFSELGKSIK